MSEVKENGRPLTGMETHWASLTPDEKAIRSKAMSDGRKRAKLKRLRDAKLKSATRSQPSSIDQTLELTKLAASLLELAGSREAVDHLMDIAELVKGGA